MRDKGSLELCSPRNQLRGQDGWRLSYWNKDNHCGRNDNFDYSNDNVLYPLSLEKIARMYKGAVDNGFASYAEA